MSITSMPAHPAQRPAHPAQWPAHPAQRPAHPAQWPAHTEQWPAHTEQWPANTAQVPAYPARGPANTAQVPTHTAQEHGRNHKPTEQECADAWASFYALLILLLIAIIAVVIGLWVNYDLLKKQRRKADCTIGNVELIRTNKTKNEYLARLGITYNQFGKTGIFYIYAVNRIGSASRNWPIYSKIPYWMTKSFEEAMKDYNGLKQVMTMRKVIVNKCVFEPNNVANIEICMVGLNRYNYYSEPKCNNRNYNIISGITVLAPLAVIAIVWSMWL